MKQPVRPIPVILSTAVALVSGLLVVLFTNEIVTGLYCIGVVLISALALLLVVILRKHRQQRIITVLVFVVVTGMVVFNEYHVRPYLYWMMWAQRYKSEVLASSDPHNNEFKHVEWDGDGWGSAVTGDWSGYIVFDPTDSLPAAVKSNAPARYDGIPCDVISVRRLEKQWYSVVVDMNQFWDAMHPNCGR